MLLFIVSGCRPEQDIHYVEKVADVKYLHRSMDNLTDIIVHDIFSPPVASRIYAYASIVAYEILEQQDEGFRTLGGQLNGFEGITPCQDTVVNYYIAAVDALNKLGMKMIFSEHKMSTYMESLYHEWDSLGVPEKVLHASTAYADQVVYDMVRWMDKDMYNQTRTYPKFTVNDEPGRWKPTPPAYMDAIEPSWREIRTMVLDSAQQFVPPPPPKFNMDPGSSFYMETIAVYNAVNDRTKEHEEIALFWDCNPYVMHTKGHVMFATKKITPGGHWMGIAGIACRKLDLDMMHSSEVYLMTSIALFDGFISCWDEKYRSNLIRPETVINEYIDPDWMPVLQTPPFPEHTSGHSVISAAAAIALTSILGEDFEFEDDVEVDYGLPIRTFSSFIEASDEAAISRLYGGIHYMPAIEDGVRQGRKIGELVSNRILTRNG